MDEWKVFGKYPTCEGRIMRNIPTVFDNRIKSKKQVAAERSDPRLIFIVSRPKTPLISSRFMETQAVQTSGEISAVDIAVAHPRYHKRDTEIHIAYIESGIAKVKRAMWKAKMKDHVWIDLGISLPASDVAICYNSKCVDHKRGKYEYLTEPAPWLFWINGGGLYARKTDSTDTATLATANATKVSAVRATYSEVELFNTGLIVFFLVSGQLYYKQLIDDTWYDAELVSFGPSGVTYVDITVERTWDYRVVVQGITANGEVYELYSQFSGIGTRNQEHIKISSLEAKGKKIEVTHTELSQVENINVEISGTGERLWAHSSIPIEGFNIDDGNGNHGIYVKVKFDHPIHSVTGQASCFSLKDSNNVVYACEEIQLSEDGIWLTLKLADFNLAALASSGEIVYMPGEIMSPAVQLEGFSFEVELTGLVPPAIAAPEVEAIYND